MRRKGGVPVGGAPVSESGARGIANVAVIAVLATVLLCGCPGCWGSRDIEERAFVLMLGLDSGDQGIGDQGIRVSAQVAINERMASAWGGEGDAFTVVHHDAESISAGLNLLQDATARPVYLGHLKVVVLGREFARGRGVSEAVEVLMREPEVRGRVWIVQAEERAEDLLRARLKAERMPASYIEELLNVGVRSGHVPDSRLIEVGVRIDTPGRHVVLPILRTGDESVEIGGASVFRGDRAVSELEHLFIHDYSLVAGTPSVGVYSVPSPRGSGRLYAAIRNARPRVRVTREAGGVVINLRITAEAEAVEDTGHGGAPGPGWAGMAGRIPQVEKMLGDEIAMRAAVLIKKVQDEAGADIFGFVRYAGALKYGETDWDEVFPTAKVQVEARVRLTRFGMGEA